MSIKTNELKQAASVNAEDYLLADSPTAGTVRVPLSAAAEYFDEELLKSGTQLHAALSNKANMEMLPNPNLLDNWYFIDLVNQRGNTEYTENGYIFDRWMMYRGKITLTSNGITYQWNGESASSGLAYGIILRQMLESTALVTGQIVTISFLLQDKMLTFTTIVPSNASNNYVDIEPFNITIERLENGVLGISLLTTDTQPVTVIAAKLELGTHQTLAHKEGEVWVLNDPPPNKALELLKCQRYQTRILGSFKASSNSNGGILDVTVPLSVPMRTTPTPKSMILSYIYHDGNSYEVSNFEYVETLYSEKSTNLIIRFGCLSALAAKKTGSVNLDIILDANL